MAAVWDSHARAMRTGSVDGLGSRYSAVANDDNKSTAAREAAMLLAVAEGHIKAEEDEDALVAAQDALKHFREVSDHCSVADAVRVIVQCYVCQGRLEEAMALARDEASVFKRASKKPEEGKMLLALSEACPKQPKSLEEALSYSRDALNLFQEARDEKMEAAGWLTTARLLMTKKGDKEEALKEAWQATCDALTIFQRLRDVKGEAEALHTQAEVKAADSKFLEAVEVAQDALDLFQDLELKKQEAFELQHIAGLLVAAGMPRKSLEFAEEALEIIRSSKGSAKKEVEALGLVVRALIARERPKKAVEVGTKGLKRFQKDGENLDAQAEAKATMIVQEAYQASGDKIRTATFWRNALELAADSGLKRMEYDMCIWAAELHLSNLNEGEIAGKMANRALEAAHELKDDEAVSGALKRMVKAYVQTEDTEKAVALAKENRENMEKAGSTKGEASACLVLADAHCAAKNFDLAAAAAKAAGEIAYQEDDEVLEGASLDTLTTINMEAGKYEKAARAAEQARRIWAAANDLPKECNALSQAGMAFVNQAYKKQAGGKAASSVAGFFEKATKAGNDCLALTETLGPAGAPFAANANCVLSQVHAAQGEIELSMSTAKDAVKLYSTVGDTRGEGYGQVLISQANCELKKWDAAQKAANSAMKLFKKVQDTSGQEFAQTLLTKIEKNMPKPEPVYAAAQWGPPGGARAWNTGPSMQMSMQMDMGPAPDAGGAAPNIKKRESGPGLDLAALTEEVLQGKIKEVALAIIGDDGEIDGDTPLMEAGVTSSTAVILKDELGAEVPGVRLPPTLIFDYPSINAISEFIMESVSK